jgi:hypothetical protein
LDGQLKENYGKHAPNASGFDHSVWLVLMPTALALLPAANAFQPYLSAHVPRWTLYRLAAIALWRWN